mgnify:CR=1 FL=1
MTRKLDLEESRQIREAESRCGREEEEGAIGFWFVKAEFILARDQHVDGALPR